MENYDASQEILLMTNSTSSQINLCKRDAPRDEQMNFLRKDSLEEACWNGLFRDWLPNAIDEDSREHRLFLWRIYVANTFLCLQLSENPSSVISAYSLNPYLFIPAMNAN